MERQSSRKNCASKLSHISMVIIVFAMLPWLPVHGKHRLVEDEQNEDSLILGETRTKRSANEQDLVDTDEANLVLNSTVQLTVPQDTRTVLKDLFTRYGNGDHMTLEGFEHLLESLNLGNIVLDHRLTEHFPNGEPAAFVDKHPNHNHTEGTSSNTTAIAESPEATDQRRSRNVRDIALHRKRKGERDAVEETDEDLGPRVKRHAGHDHSNQDQSQEPPQNTDKKCMPALKMFGISAKDITSPLGPTDFLNLCPVLVYELEQQRCTRSSTPTCSDAEVLARCQKLKSDDPKDPVFNTHYGSLEDDEQYNDRSSSSSDLSVESDGVVAPFYVWGYALLSCIIISAVGLVCVAIIPIMHKSVYNHLLQFLVAMAIGSLTGDALLHLIPHAIAPHSHTDITLPDDSEDLHSHGNHDDHGDHGDKSAVWIGLVALAGIYFFFLMERVLGIVTRRRRHKNRKKRKQQMTPEEAESTIGTKLSSHQDMTKSCEQVLMVVHPNKDLRGLSADAHDEVHQHCDDAARESWAPGHAPAPGHNHAHEVPESVSSVAWMVVMGDGLHNFSDGLAIGASFASGLTSGLSTSVAVFCHELPHELGDFAVLIRAGMSVKQALVYNCISSVLCLVGMVLGIVVGNLASANQWIFATIAGMFIYIALVDMLPELTNVTPKVGESPLCHLGLQSAGMVTGAGIMLVIALYEERITFPAT